MSTWIARLPPLLGLSIVVGGAQPVLARGGGGPPVSSMTKQYCTEQVVNKGILDITRFNAEVQKCLNNPVTYPPTYR
jgi:hypothetical protein